MSNRKITQVADRRRPQSRDIWTWLFGEIYR